MNTKMGLLPRICFVSPHIWPVLADDRSVQMVGGAEFRQSILARALASAGYSVSIVTLDYGQDDATVVHGVTTYRAHKPSGGIPGVRFFHPRLTSWFSALKRADADVYIQSCAGLPTAIVALFSRLHSRRFVYSGAHDLDFERDQTWKVFRRPRGWRDRQLYQWGLRTADAIVAQHERQAQSCRRWYSREAHVVRNCYAPPAGAASSKDGVVLWVATLRSWKRPELFIELARALPRLRFRMIGGAGSGEDSSIYERVRRQAASLPNLEFVGFVPLGEIERHFNDARVFVNTSEYEGFPNTFLQSWARAIPTVSFIDCGAYEAGRPIGSICRDLGDMKAVVARIGEDDDAWQEEGLRARGYFESHHSVVAAVEGYGRLFEGVLAQSPRREGGAR
jgi:glycosyltransferase involved in cell wall biosynthesis